MQGRHDGARQTVHFGPGSRRVLADALTGLGVDRALLVTGRTVAASGLIDEVLQATGDTRVQVWDGSREHAPRSAVEAGVAEVQRTGAQAVISVGGSSPVEVARAVTMAVADPQWTTRPRPLAAPLDTPMLPVVAVTTTLSQAEFTNFVGVTDDATGEKHLYADHGLLPRVVVLDAELTTRTPHALWASTGVKALDSAIGGHVQQVPQLFRDPVTTAAVGELVELLGHLADGDEDAARRQRLQVAAWMAMFPRFQLPTTQPNPPGLPWFGSAARHQLGGASRVRHGELSGVLLPAAIEFHLDDAGERIAGLAEPLGMDPAGLAAHVRDVVRALGLPTTLTELGVDPQLVPGAVEAMVREQPALGERHDDVVAALDSVR